MASLPVIPIDVDAEAAKGAVDFSDEENVKPFMRRCRWVSVDIAGYRFLRFNWLVTAIASIILWAFVIYVCTQDNNKDSKGNNPAFVEFNKWQTWVTHNFTWLYIGTQDVWMVFVIWIAFSKYGSLKLGKDTETPAYTDFSWFAMLFTCGIAVGLYFYGVQETMNYYRGGSSSNFQKPGARYNDDDQRAQQALNMTLYHWGFHAWACYILAALTIGFVAYRWNMPLTVRCAFYPLIGDVVYGPLGDFIDAISMACTTFGVTTSLGFGVQNILSGMHRLDCGRSYNCAWTTVPNNDGTSEAKDWMITIIALITIISTISIMTGLNRGIWFLSQFAFIVGSFTLTCLLFLDNTWFLLNSYVQSLGFYIQYLIQLGTACDTWQQLMWEWNPNDDSANMLWGSGRDMVYDTVVTAVQGLGTLPSSACAGQVTKAAGCTLSDYFGLTAGNLYFMDWWTIFYWGWWISWTPFVGTFIARISRGRTIREVVAGGMLAPIIYSFFYLVVLGSLGIKMERVAETALGVTANLENGAIDCALMGYKNSEPFSAKAIQLADAGYIALPCRPGAMMYYDIMYPYGKGIGDFLSVMSLIGIICYFVTSSDSGSYVDDLLAAGGMDEPPVIQRVYWACTEGAIAMCLMYYGGEYTMRALRSISIVSGLPFTFFMCFMVTALIRAVKYDCKEEAITTSTRFTTGLWDWTEGFCPTAQSEYGPSIQERLRSLLVAIFLPGFEMHKVHALIYEPATAWFWTVSTFALQFGWILCMCLELDTKNLSAIGWTFYIFMVCFMTIARYNARERYNVYGFLIEDFFCCMTMYPFVASQLSMQASLVPVPQDVAETKGDFEFEFTGPAAVAAPVDIDRACC